MSVVSLLGVNILNNPAKFGDKYVFEITFECLEQLEKDLEWKLTYVGSATSDQYDQELDSLLVGPIPVGVNKFVFEAEAPDTKRIPDADVLGVTVVLLTCSYDGREFIRVGYYVNNEYETEELNADPRPSPSSRRSEETSWPISPVLKGFRSLCAGRVPPEQPEADVQPDDEEYGAEELAEEAEEEDATAAGAANGEAVAAAAGGDDAMGGIEGGEPAEEDEMSEDGSVDLENESEDDLEEEGEEEMAEGGAGGDDAMEVDEAPAGGKAPEVMAH
ncbi:hypothetical protein PG993_013752 [Apiospora rasikravindrae]|uniref:Histone chaperone n=1 Tax=Apiospora rasikravindrae TaxID=990691 RepID=A0ABR1RR30_9PEZI